MSGDIYADQKVVWILGSGFSKSLGGPLLADLLSHRGYAYVKSRFKIDPYNLYYHYWKHLKDSQESRGEPVYWDHAEEFLDFIDSARRDINDVRYRIFGKLVHNDQNWEPTGPDDLEHWRALARKCVANECAFATHLSGEIEGIEPYVRWGKMLRPSDTIITFNYDLVLETLGGRRGHELPFRREAVAQVKEEQLDVRADEGLVRVLKLHGSIDWKGGEENARWDPIGAQDDPYIATPGPGKYNACRGVLKPLWDDAIERIKAANVIVLLGYRFPPSDSQSRQVLLGAINAIHKSRYVRIHTVLGPNIHHEHSVRLLNLLAHTLEDAGRLPSKARSAFKGRGEEFHVFQHPLYVEDFLSVVHANMLYGRKP